MTIEFKNHLHKRLKERNVKLQQVIEVIKNLNNIKDNTRLYIRSKKYNFIIVTKIENNTITVITVITDFSKPITPKENFACLII